MISDADYVAKGGNRCPFCGSSNIDGEGVDIGVGKAKQECTCQACYACWYDDYKLVGYTIISHPIKPQR